MTDEKLSEVKACEICAFIKNCPSEPEKCKLNIAWKILTEKAKKWDELCDPLAIFATTGDFGAAVQRHFKLQEAERRLRAVSDWIKTKRTSKDFAFTVGFISSDELDELEAALHGSESEEINRNYKPPSCFGRFPFEIDGNQECRYCGCNDAAQIIKGKKPDCREETRKKKEAEKP